jgi:hypothetical protein
MGSQIAPPSLEANQFNEIPLGIFIRALTLGDSTPWVSSFSWVIYTTVPQGVQ